jgi:hypothetical protein
VNLRVVQKKNDIDIVMCEVQKARKEIVDAKENRVNVDSRVKPV